MIHPQAIVDPGAELDSSVEVGPFSVIGPDVQIGAGTRIHSHVVINGPTTIGADNEFYQFGSIGQDPQDLSYKGEPTRLEIGDRNTIREGVTLNRGTASSTGVTRIGNDNLLMAYTHLAHDCQLGNHIIFANCASLGGHVVVEDHVTLAGFAIVHQFCHIGAYSFLGMGSSVNRDVPPYVTVAGHPAGPHGINQVGLKRRGFDDDQVRLIKRAYKLLYRKGLPLKTALEEITALDPESADLQRLTDFIGQSSRSIIR